MWLVWRAGSPDPSRPSPAIHHDDPARDRDRNGWLGQPILIAPEHHAMTLRELLTIDAYNLPAGAGAVIDGTIVKPIGDGGVRSTSPAPETT